MDAQQESPKINTWMKIVFWLAVLVFFIFSYLSVMRIDVISPVSRKEYLIRVLTALSKPNLSDGEINRYVAIKILETLQIAFLATIMSAMIASLFTYFSARPTSIWGRGFKFILQPILAGVRAVHPLVGVIFVIIVVGIGPKSGVITLTIFSTAMLTAIFSDYARQHMSLKWSMLFKAHFPGLAFKYFSVNILIASVLGFMGGGGIGFFLQQSINLLDYSNVSTALTACIIVFGGLDLISRAVWYRIQSKNVGVHA